MILRKKRLLLLEPPPEESSSLPSSSPVFRLRFPWFAWRSYLEWRRSARLNPTKRPSLLSSETSCPPSLPLFLPPFCPVPHGPAWEGKWAAEAPGRLGLWRKSSSSCKGRKKGH